MSEAKICCNCGRVGHRANKCEWPAWRKPREIPSREQKRAGVAVKVGEQKCNSEK